MLIPGKLHSRVESRNSQVLIETLDFARVHTFTGVIGVGSPVEARRGGGAIAGQLASRSRMMCSSPPADDRRSQWWRARNVSGMLSHTT